MNFYPYDDAFQLKKSDIPEELWPGVPVDREMLENYQPDPRDFYTVDQRLAAFDEINLRHTANWFGDLPGHEKPEISPDVIAVIGDIGSGRSVVAHYEAIRRYMAGVQLFHNGWMTVGRNFAETDISMLPFEVPSNSIVVIEDVISGILRSTRISMDVFMARQGMIVDAMMNLKKRNCMVILIPMLGGLISNSVRQGITKVWECLNVNKGGDAADLRFAWDVFEGDKAQVYLDVWERCRRHNQQFPSGAAEPIFAIHPRDFVSPDRTEAIGPAGQNEMLRLALMATDSFGAVQIGREDN